MEMENIKKPYVAPMTTLTQIQMESCICAASLESYTQPGDNINMHRHIYIEDIPEGGSFTYNGWDE